MTFTRSSSSARSQVSPELEPLVKNWWMMAGRGVLAMLFGAAIALWRVPVFDAVVVSFGAYAILDGLLAISSALRAARSWTAGWPIALEGVISAVLGTAALNFPLFPDRVIDVLIVWSLLTGILEIVAAVRLPRELAGHWLVGTGGASSIFLGVLVLALPHALSDRIALALAAYALVFGIVILLASVRFRLALGVDVLRARR